MFLDKVLSLSSFVITLYYKYFYLATLMLFFAGVPSLDKLSLLKQTRSDGQVQRLHIIIEVCPKWKEIQDLMGVSACHLEAIKKNTRGEVKECCRDTFFVTCWSRREEETIL